MLVPERQVYGLPPGLPGARYYPELGQQTSPRGFGQQMSAAGRVAGKACPYDGIFGLGQEEPKDKPWLAIAFGLTAVAGIGLLICLTSRRPSGAGGGMGDLDESKAARKFIARKIRKLYGEGYRGKQAVAIAYSMARKKGYRLPKT
jgi:hypothetical protein